MNNKGTTASPWIVFSTDCDTGVFIGDDGQFRWAFDGIEYPLDDWLRKCVERRHLDAFTAMLLRHLVDSACEHSTTLDQAALSEPRPSRILSTSMSGMWIDPVATLAANAKTSRLNSSTKPRRGETLIVRLSPERHAVAQRTPHWASWRSA